MPCQSTRDRTSRESRPCHPRTGTRQRAVHWLRSCPRTRGILCRFKGPTVRKGLNALGTLLRHPELVRAFNTFNGHILFGTTLSLRHRELLVLRLGALRQCEYEWKQHVVQGADAGITADEIDRIEQGPDAPGWSPFERAMLRAVDELVVDACITDDTWSALGSANSTRNS